MTICEQYTQSNEVKMRYDPSVCKVYEVLQWRVMSKHKCEYAQVAVIQPTKPLISFNSKLLLQPMQELH